jgi:hypothetical protein
VRTCSFMRSEYTEGSAVSNQEAAVSRQYSALSIQHTALGRSMYWDRPGWMNSVAEW